MKHNNSVQKKAMIIANTTWNIQNFRLNIIRALLERSFEVVVVAPEDEFTDFIETFPSVKYIPLYKLERKGLSPFADFSFLLELIKIYKSERPDITIHYTIKPNIYGSVAARITDKKCISVVTGLGYTFIHNGWIEKLSTALYRFAFRSNEKVVFENNDDRLLFIDKRIVSASKALSVKGCGINTEHFNALRDSQSSEDVFLFIGRLLYDKGIREYVRAAEIVKKKYPNVRFWIAGNIDEENPAAITKTDLERWIAEGIIEYKGFVKDVRKVIEPCTCVVLPSYREAIARALQEGMAMEKPVISTNVPGCREAVDDGENGYLVPVRDAVALSKAMLRFLSLTPKDREQMGKNGRKKVLAQFDERLIAEDFMRVVIKVI